MRRFFLWIFAAAMAIHAKAQTQDSLLTIGDPAPPLEVAAWLKGGETATLEPGKIHIVEFWATWCAPCIANIPHLAKLAEKYKSDGVNVYGISVQERKGVSIDSLRRFVKTKGQEMDYHVGADGERGSMARHWLWAAGQRGIPFAIVVERTGKVAWMGNPTALDRVLQKIVAGQWNLSEKAEEQREYRRLRKIDKNLIPVLNPYMGKDYPGAKRILDSVLTKEPALKYYPITGHYLFNTLLHMQPADAVPFAREWWDANDEPSWKSVSDAVFGASGRGASFSPPIYLLAVDALQAQLDHYPWSMDFPGTYMIMADLSEKAGLKEQADEFRKKAERYSSK